MRKLVIAALITLVSTGALASEKECAAYLDQDVRKLRSDERINLCDAFAGKPLLVVNTASHCGFTRQFAGLEALYQTYKEQGLEVLGVPSNDFRQGEQDEKKAARICYLNYGVTFTMLSQQQVRGPTAHPVFQELNRNVGEPSWNFNKYLLDRDGNVVKRFGSGVEPMSGELRDAVEALL